MTRSAPRTPLFFSLTVATVLLAALLSVGFGAAARTVQSGPAATAPEDPPGTSEPGPANPAAGDELFFERIDVDVVNVEVWVTDHRGNRVTGLTPDDFEVFEDGKPVEVTNFYTVEWSDSLLANPRPATGPGSMPGLPEGQRQLPPDQQLSVAIFVDNAHLFPEHRRKVLDLLDGFLEDRVIEGDNLMLVSYDTGLHVVQPFTHDRWAIIDAIRQVRKQTAMGPMREAQRRQVISSISMMAATSFQSPNQAPEADSAYGIVRSYVQSAVSDLRRTTAALEKAVHMVAGLPGRKAILYVSGGLEQRPGEEMFQHLEDTFGVQGLRDQSSQVHAVIEPAAETIAADQSDIFAAVARTANANQVTLYTLDASGAGVGSFASADHGPLDVGVTAGGRVNMESARHFNLVEPLIGLATATGGTSIVNTTSFGDALTSMAADFDSYYSLGYRGPSGGDGAYHQIEVRTTRPGLRLRYRTGYVDKPRVDRVADRTLSSLLLSIESNPLDVSVQMGRPERAANGHYLLPVLVRIPLSQITVLPNGDQREGKLQIFVAVKDDDGGVSDLHQHAYPIKIDHADLDRALKQEIGYLARLELRPGKPIIAVGVWDELSGTESFVQKRALVGDAVDPRQARRGR